ncbi:MAG: DUF2225 domain-containing protein [Lachnospiraceae bacterium]|nr:DUF2225 domain-containing protein [Lachnospiraceae bacterium]
MRGNLPGNTIEEIYSSESHKLIDEEMFIFDKHYECPVCGQKFRSKSVRAGKMISDGRDVDLKPRYVNVDGIKYRPVVCAECGYANMDNSFTNITKKEAELLRNSLINNNFIDDIYARDYKEAYEAYKAIVRCDLIRCVKNGKRAHTALYAAWLLRSWREYMEILGVTISETALMRKEEELKLLKYAYKNFKEAEIREDFPINGIPEATFDYMMAALAYEIGEIFEAERYIRITMHKRELKPIIRRYAEDLMEEIKAKIKSGKETGA